MNILEYAFALDPNHPDLAPPVTGALSRGCFCLGFKRNIGATELTYSVEMASQLNNCWTLVTTFSQPGGWTPDTTWGVLSESAPSGTAPDAYVLVTLAGSASATNLPSCFFRVQVSTAQ
jgi:hypothetical protein